MIRINGEPCEKVERFEELRTGMVVYVSPCGCGANHRHILLNCRTSMVRPTMAMRGGFMPAFDILPEPLCSPADDVGPPCIGPPAVEAGRVYRVVDELEALDALEKRRKSMARA